jgi:hypothetical protein
MNSWGGVRTAADRNPDSRKASATDQIDMHGLNREPPIALPRRFQGIAHVERALEVENGLLRIHGIRRQIGRSDKQQRNTALAVGCVVDRIRLRLDEPQQAIPTQRPQLRSFTWQAWLLILPFIT